MIKSLFKNSFFVLCSFFTSLSWAADEPFDTTSWQRVLETGVSEEGFVDYAKLKEHPQELDAFLEQVAKVSPKNRPELFPTKNEQMVYWLQVYNALAMKNVLNFPGLKKTSDKKRLFFVTTKFEVGGEKFSLQELENDWIRPQFQEARAHFFLNCASYSCPRLYREPLRADQLDEQLNRFSQNFLNDEKHLRFDEKTGILWLSKILYWYQGDFLNAMKNITGSNEDKLIAFVNQYRAEKIPREKVKKIKYFDYNWTVNDVKNLEK